MPSCCTKERKLNEEVITWVELTEMQQRVWLLIGVHYRSWTKMPRVTRKYWLCVCALQKFNLLYHIFHLAAARRGRLFEDLSGRATRGTVMTGYPRSRTSVKISHEFQSACIVLVHARSAPRQGQPVASTGGGAQITGLLLLVRLTVIALIL